MRSAQELNLPTATAVYDVNNEQTARRTVEQYMGDLREDVVGLEEQTSAPGTLALRRHQFLLMGA